MPIPTKQLILRGDDAGGSLSANRALEEAANAGVLRNVSVMAPGTFLEDAARRLAHRRDLCFGLHITLNAEWRGPKWGPVLPVSEVPSLVDAEEHFLPTPHDTRRANARLAELLAEAQAQLDKLRAVGFPVSYLDEHMGVGWLPGLRDGLAALAARESLLDAMPLNLPGLPPLDNAPTDLVNHWLARLEAAPPGTYLMVTHPGMDTAEMHQFFHDGLEPGQVARERDAERLALADPRLLAGLSRLGVQSTQYTEAIR